jgi:Protein of unknown function (DUF3999)
LNPRASLTAFLVPLIAVAGALSSTWRNWHFYRPIVLPTNVTARLVSVELPDDVYSGAQADLADVRVVDDQEQETPYILRQGVSQPAPQVRRSAVIERSYSPGVPPFRDSVKRQYSQIVLDLGDKPLMHDRVNISVPEDNFFAWVEVAVSDNARDWRIIKDRAPIFRFRSENREGTQTVRYPDSLARYLRLRILDSKSDVRSAAVEVSAQTAPAAKYIPSSVALELVKRDKETIWHATLPAADIPITQVRFDTTQPEFDRAVTVEFSEDGVDWTTAGSGDIYRFQREGRQAEKLDLPVSLNSVDRQLRITIANGSDAPLQAIHAQLMETPANVFFEAQPQRSYSLLFGNTQAQAPRYDLVRTVDDKDLASAGTASLGAAELNTNYADARPWTEQHPVLMWSALIAAAAVLGALALAALRSSSGSAVSKRNT